MAYTALLGSADSMPGNLVPGFDPNLVLTGGTAAGSIFESLPAFGTLAQAGSIFTRNETLQGGAQAGSVFSVGPSLREGAQAGSVFSLTSVHGNLVGGARAGSHFAADSGDIANGRYRR